MTSSPKVQRQKKVERPKLAKEKLSVKPDDKEQSKLFIAKAREIGTDEDRSGADRLLGHLAKMPPEPRVGKQKARGKIHGA
jgi:hypothetical protein